MTKVNPLCSNHDFPFSEKHLPVTSVNKHIQAFTFGVEEMIVSQFDIVGHIYHLVIYICSPTRYTKCCNE